VDFADIQAVKWLVKKEIHERSYRELVENAEKIRRGLAAEGFAGKHIALIGASSVEWIESYLGIITGKTVAVPLDVNLPAEDLIDLVNRSDSEGLFLSPKHRALAKTFLAECPQLRKVWILHEDETEGLGQQETAKDAVVTVEQAGGQNMAVAAEKAAEQPDAVSAEKVAEQTDAATAENVDGKPIQRKISSLGTLKTFSAQTTSSSASDADRPSPENIATIIFTSGTTGKSKGVMLTQDNLASNVRSVDYYTKPGTVLLSVLPIHHAFCLVMDWLKGFSLGTTICINDSLLHMVKNMSVFKPDVMLMVPMMIETIYKKMSAANPLIPKKLLAAQVFGGNLKIIFVGGAHLDPFYIEKFARLGVDVLEGYGMSECSPVISSNTPSNHKAGTIGRPLANAEIAFEDGEILVRGSSVMKGYYKMPEETAETLKDGWLHTGDKGYLDEDGYLYINGRVKNLIILSNGENISPEEIENKLALNKLVGEVIVTGEDNGLTARIYPDQDVVKAKKMDKEAIRAALQKILDEYNRAQPTYRRITGLVVRENPFARSSTKKIKRQEALVDEPAKAS
jgi:long-chain acyl-CoA synthetase